MPRSPSRLFVILGSFLFSQAVLLLILKVPAMATGSWLVGFRGYFNFDQLSYAAIASDVAAGVSGLPEPFTETGHSYYPSLWYRILGWIARVTGASVPTVWTIAGWLLLAVCVAVVGYVGLCISRKSWAPALVGPFLCIGTLSIALFGDWFITLESHAKLWGPYGTLYVLNAEVAGIALITLALSMILAVTLIRCITFRVAVTVLSLAALLLGVTANVHTYAFFIGIGIACSWAAVYGLLLSKSRVLLIASVVLFALAFLGGNAVAHRVGALPAFGVFVTCSLPGAGWLLWRRLKYLIAPLALFIVTAAPQLSLVVSGYLARDPFLTYRQDQSADLGVPVWTAIVATLPIASVWVFNVLVQRRSSHFASLAALGGIAFSAIMLTFNGAWGFGQEPYRLWIGSITVSALILSMLTARSIADLQVEQRGSLTPGMKVTTAIMVGLVALSMLDFGAFRVYVEASGMTRFDSTRANAIREVTTKSQGLLAYGPCVDPQELKIISRKPVAYYNLGIAWPDNKAAIDAVVDAYRAGAFAPDALRKARVTYLVTDSGCAFTWPVEGDGRFFKSRSVDYGDGAATGTITLWRVI